MSLQILAGLANILGCVRRANSSRSRGMSPDPSQGTEVTAPVHVQGCWDGAQHWHSKCHRATTRALALLCYSSWEESKAVAGFLMAQSSQCWCFILHLKHESCRSPAALPSEVHGITWPLARLDSPSLRWQQHLDQPRASWSPPRQVSIRHTWIALTI